MTVMTIVTISNYSIGHVTVTSEEGYDCNDYREY